jgi:ATP-dependent exoDNAse (exonuclease V) alpha subunit
MGEIDGVPRDVLVAFSRRRQQIVEHLETRGRTGFHAAQAAAIRTRDRKEDVDLHGLLADWWARAEEHGFGPAQLAAMLDRDTRALGDAAGTEDLITELVGDGGLTEKRTTFSRADAIMAIANASEGGRPAREVLGLADELLEDLRVTRLSETVPGLAGRYSTEHLLALEREALAVVERGRTADAPSISFPQIHGADLNSGTRLSEEQLAYVEGAATASERVVCVVGVAGAGKTTATTHLVRALTGAGIRVVGTAPSGAAARGLSDATGLEAVTIHRLLAVSEREGGLPRRAVVIVDEAGMADTRTLTPLLRHAEQADAKMILIGDPEQLPPVGAGGLFRAIIERVGALELHQNRRQQDPEERTALTAIRLGDGHDYVDWAASNQRLVVAPNPISARTRLLTDWWEHAQLDPAANVMIALKRRDVSILNSLGRALMDRTGRLGTDRLVAGDREFAVGDRIVCVRNNDLLGVLNGTRGTVRSVDQARRTLVVTPDGGTDVLLSSRYIEDGHLRHGYALTGHSAQGATVARAFVLSETDRALKEWGYVGLSRATTATHVYLTNDAKIDSNNGTTPQDRFGDSLSRPSQEPLASDVSL